MKKSTTVEILNVPETLVPINNLHKSTTVEILNVPETYVIRTPFTYNLQQ